VELHHHQITVKLRLQQQLLLTCGTAARSMAVREQRQQRLLQQTQVQGCMTSQGRLLLLPLLQQQRVLSGASPGSISSWHRLMLALACRRGGQ
jgi:hypothetical protein